MTQTYQKSVSDKLETINSTLKQYLQEVQLNQEQASPPIITSITNFAGCPPEIAKDYNDKNFYQFASDAYNKSGS